MEICSMLNKIFESLFANHKRSDSQANSSVVQAEKFLIIDESRYQYESIKYAVPIVNVDVIVDSQKELIERINFLCGLSSKVFEELVMPIIRNYAQYVHLLPATCNENHRDAGGLFQLGLDVGFIASQAFDGKSHPRKQGVSPSGYHRKWVIATLIAGICAQIYRPMATMNVVSDDGHIWPYVLKPFYTWTKEINSRNFKIVWIRNNIKTDEILNYAATYALGNMIPKQCIQYLIDDNLEILSCMASAISQNSVSTVRNSISESVAPAMSFVIDKDMKRQIPQRLR